MVGGADDRRRGRAQGAPARWPGRARPLPAGAGRRRRLISLALLANMLIMQSSNAAFRALADPTRRDILQLLHDGPRTSGDIAARFESSWPTISRHLALLRDAGL